MLVGEAGGDAAAWGAVEEADLDEEGFVDLFEGVLLFGEGGGEGVEADGAAVVLFDDGAEETAVELVEAVGVDFEEFEGGVGGGAVDDAGGADLGVVADAAQETVGDARGAAGTHGDFGGAIAVDGDVEDFGGALDDETELVVGVELQAQQDAEAGAHGRAEQAGARGGGDEGEGLDVELEGAGAGALADHDVEAVVFEGGVELLLKDGREAVDFVEEEDLLFLDVGEDGRQIAGDDEAGAAGLLEGSAHFVGDDGGEGGFAEAGRAEEEDVVEGFAAGFGGFEGDGELLLGLGLADEFRKFLRAELELERGVVVERGGGGDQALGFGSGMQRVLRFFVGNVHKADGRPSGFARQ